MEMHFSSIDWDVCLNELWVVFFFCPNSCRCGTATFSRIKKTFMLSLANGRVYTNPADAQRYRLFVTGD